MSDIKTRAEEWLRTMPGNGPVIRINPDHPDFQRVSAQIKPVEQVKDRAFQRNFHWADEHHDTSRTCKRRRESVNKLR